jgi:hypothetical protein
MALKVNHAVYEMTLEPRVALLDALREHLSLVGRFPMNRVTFELGDSWLPEAPVSGGSQSLASVAPAVQAAPSRFARSWLPGPSARGGQDIVADGTAKPGEEKTQFSMHSFGAVFAEVQVDPELGTIRVPITLDKILARQDRPATA